MTITDAEIHYTNREFRSAHPRPLGDYAPRERELIALTDLILTAMVRLEIYGSRPEANDRLIAYFDRWAGCDEQWREHLLTLIKAFRDEEGNSND